MPRTSQKSAGGQSITAGVMHSEPAEMQMRLLEEGLVRPPPRPPSPASTNGSLSPPPSKQTDKAYSHYRHRQRIVHREHLEDAASSGVQSQPLSPDFSDSNLGSNDSVRIPMSPDAAPTRARTGSNTSSSSRRPSLITRLARRMSSSLTGSSTGSQVLAGELGREGSAQSVMAPISYSGAPSASSVASLRIDPASGQLSMSNSMRMMRRSETKAGSIDDGMLHVGKGGGGGGSSLGHSHGASSRSSVFSQESSLPSIMSKITHKIEDWLAEAPPMPDVQSDLDELVERLVISKESKTRTFCLDQREIMSVCSMAKKALLADPSLLALAAPVKIVGNLNGHYNDLLGIITACGVPANTSYLFLGGYVSHGVRSLETICLLLCYKVKYPNTFFLLRGSEETPGATKTGGFLDECKKRASMTVWRELISVFDCMPLAAVIKKKIFCVHSGLSPSLNRIEDISNIQRPYMFEHTGIVADLLFSQPDEVGREEQEVQLRLEKLKMRFGQVDNAELAWTDSKTGIGYEFNTRVLHSFLNYNSFDLMVRSKQLVQHGFEFWGKQRLVSIFSASQFCGRHDNDGAVLEVDAHLKCSFTVIESVERKQ